jgi:hypothetical protein
LSSFFSSLTGVQELEVDDVGVDKEGVDVVGSTLV